MLTGRERLILCGSAREQMVTTAIFSVRPAAWPHRTATARAACCAASL